MSHTDRLVASIMGTAPEVKNYIASGEAAKRFTGELMRCVMCGREERSVANKTSDWRYIEIDDRGGCYACPKEFPADGSGREAFAQAYARIFARIIMLRERRGFSA